MKRLLIFCFAALLCSAGASAQEPNYALADQFSAKKVGNMVFSTAIRPNWFKISTWNASRWRFPPSSRIRLTPSICRSASSN